MSLTLSDGSDFYKAVSQVVKQFLDRAIAKSITLLPTSPDSSGSIIRTVAKLTRSCRLNATEPFSNPLSKAESEVLQKVRGLVRQLMESATSAFSEKVFVELMGRLFIHVFDIEAVT